MPAILSFVSIAYVDISFYDSAYFFDRLDGVVSNAGIGMGGTPLHEYDVDEYEKIFDLNSKGVFAGMKYGAEAIFKTRSEGGFLINVLSAGHQNMSSWKHPELVAGGQ